VKRFFLMSWPAVRKLVTLALFACGAGLPVIEAYGGGRLLKQEEAFATSVKRLSPTRVEFVLVVAKGYAVYAEDLEVSVQRADGQTALLTRGQLITSEPAGQDEKALLRNKVGGVVAMDGENPPVSIQMRFRGCADVGVCYPPMKRVLDLN
jgi:thiol:disulfide interchange protein DsbD